MIYKLTLGLAANLCAVAVVIGPSHAVSASAAGFLALMLFAGSVMEDVLKK